MKVYEVGEQGKPVLMLLPGTGCYWRSNFGKVIEPLAETFRVACVSYDGFDETEQTQFPTMIEETAKIEEYIKEHYDGKICAAYGCSLGGSFVGLMAARGVIHMDYGILGGSDLDQSAKLPAKLMTALMLPMIYPFLTTGRFRLPFLNRKLEKWRKAGDGYVDAFIGMMRGAGVDLSFITKESLRNQFYSDLITPLPDAIDPAGTEIHILYALKMGVKYRARYHRHFAHPVLHELDMQHEELLAVHPKEWVELIEDICRNGNQGIGKPEPLTGNLAGFWSRRINDKDRLIYQIDDENVYILACRYHYTR